MGYYEKQKEKNIKKSMKLAKVPKNATQEEIDDKMIEYASKSGVHFFRLTFTDSQLSNPEFLIKLYSKVPSSLTMCEPKTSNSVLTNNHEFMLKYIELYQKYSPSSSLSMILEKYEYLLSSPEFVMNLSNRFPNEIMSKIMYEIKFYRTYSSTEIKYANEEYKKIIEAWPLEFHCDQAKKYGSRSIRYLPKDMKGFREVVSSGIENDGFDSVKELDVSQILDNKDLIMKAHKKNGAKALVEYIVYTLSPDRTRDYMCHGEPHSYSYHDEKYARVQEALVNDPEICYILDRYMLLNDVKLQKQVKAKYVLEEDNGSSSEK